MEDQTFNQNLPTTSTPIVPASNSSFSKRKIWIIVFVILIALIYSGIFYFYLVQKQVDSPISTFTPSANSSPTIRQQLSKRELQIYTNQDFGYSLSIPKNAHYSADKNVDQALPDYLGSFHLDWNNNPEAISINVFDNLDRTIQTVNDYTLWCKEIETQFAKSGHQKRPTCTTNFPAIQTDIHEYTAFKTTIPSPVQIVALYYVPHNTFVYQIIVTYKKDNLEEKILSEQMITSFTFIN